MGSSVGSSTVRTGQTMSGSAIINNTDTTDKKQVAPEKPQDSTSSARGADPGKVAEHQLEGQMRNASLQAMAEKEMNPISPNTKVDITNRDQKAQLLRSCPQINPISTAAGNGPHLCGAAAMTNALVLSSKTPEQAKKNADAVRDLAAHAPNGGVKLSAAESAALKSMETGKMSPNDAQHVQQVMYRIGQKMPNGGVDTTEGGLTTVQMTATMSMLAKRGAFEGSSVTMHCNRGASTFDHWTTTVDGVHANSQLIGKDGKLNKAGVFGGPPPELARGTDSWQNELWLNTGVQPAELHAQIKTPDDKGKDHHALTIDTSKFDTDTLAELDFALRTGTRKVEEGKN